MNEDPVNMISSTQIDVNPKFSSKQIKIFFRESLRVREEIQEEMLEKKMEIYMEAMKKSRKRQRLEDDNEEYVPSYLLHAEQVKVQVRQFGFSILHTATSIWYAPTYRPWNVVF